MPGFYQPAPSEDNVPDSAFSFESTSQTLQDLLPDDIKGQEGKAVQASARDSSVVKDSSRVERGPYLKHTSVPQASRTWNTLKSTQDDSDQISRRKERLLKVLAQGSFNKSDNGANRYEERRAAKTHSSDTGHAPGLARDSPKGIVARSVESTAHLLLSNYFYGALTDSIDSELLMVLEACGKVYAAATSSRQAESWDTLSTALARLILALAARLNLVYAETYNLAGNFKQGIASYIREHRIEVTTHMRLVLHKSAPGVLNLLGSDIQERVPPNGSMDVWRKTSDYGGKSPVYLPVELQEERPTIGPQLPAPETPSPDTPNEVYKWFVAGFFNSLLLHHDGHYKHALREFRRAILKHLIRANFDNDRLTDLRKATFYLPWMPLSEGNAILGQNERSFAFNGTSILDLRVPQRLSSSHASTEVFEPMKKDGDRDTPRLLSSPSHDLGDRFVLTASNNERIQATTIRQYLDQTWPLGGSVMLDVLERHLQHGTTSSAVLPNGMELEATRTASGMSAIQVTGAPNFILELGEQLAWLLAATRPVLDSTVYSVIRIADQTQLNKVGGLRDVGHYHWELTVEHSAWPCMNPTLFLYQQMHSQGTLLKSASPVIHGFPTAQRPENCPGIEMAPTVLFDVITPQQLEVTASSVTIFGRHVRLKLIKETSGLFVWHVLFPNVHCLCQPHAPFLSKKVPWSAMTLASLQQYRHIISPCNNSKYSADGFAVAAVQLDGETQNQRGPDHILEDPSPSFAAHSKGTPDCVSYSSGEESLREMSIDTEMLSFSDSSDGMFDRTPTLDDKLLPLVDVVARQMLSQYGGSATLPRTCPSTAAPGANEATAHTAGRSSLHPLGSSMRPLMPAHKRAHKEDEEDGSDGDSRRQRPRRPRPARSAKIKPNKFPACPFWKLDPTEHRSCFRLTLDGIARVKQHLNRNHAPKFYCEFCMAVLSDQEAHQTPVRSRNCAYQSCQFAGLTHQQRRELSGRSKPNTSEPERWFAIWDLVFPGRNRPASAYMDSDLSEDLCRFREFAQARGPAMIAVELRTLEQAYQTPGQPDAVLEGVISRGFDVLFERWLVERRASAQQSTTPSESPSSSRGGQSVLDSGHHIQQGTPASSMPLLEDRLGESPYVPSFLGNEDTPGSSTLPPDADGQEGKCPGPCGSHNSGTNPPVNEQANTAVQDWEAQLCSEHFFNDPLAKIDLSMSSVPYPGPNEQLGVEAGALNSIGKGETNVADQSWEAQIFLDDDTFGGIDLMTPSGPESDMTGVGNGPAEGVWSLW